MRKENDLSTVMKKWLKAAGWLLLFLILWFLREPIINLLQVIGSREEIVQYAGDLGFIGPLVLTILILLQMIIAFIPGHLLMIAAGYLYGFWPGLLISWVTTVMGGQLTFYLARKYGKPLVEHLVSREVLGKWSKIAKFQGVGFYIFSLIVPIFPADVMCYVAGFAIIPARKFFLANVIGHVPVAILMNLAGAYGFELSPGAIKVIILLSIIMLVGWLLYGKIAVIDPNFEAEWEEGQIG